VNAYLSLNNCNRIPFCRAYPASNVTSVNSAAEANADKYPYVQKFTLSCRRLVDFPKEPLKTGRLDGQKDSVVAEKASKTSHARSEVRTSRLITRAFLSSRKESVCIT
jgi:hypothetical protein